MLNKDRFSFSEIDEDILFVDLTNRTDLEAIVVTINGLVVHFDLASGRSAEIGKLTFDLFSTTRRYPVFAANLQLHSSRDYICITQAYDTSGTVFDLTNPQFLKRLERGNYHPDVSRFPVAFFSRDGEPFLIHATDWNRLDITRLTTDEILTDRFVDYETNTNYFDYFHCGLSVAPGSESFISNGWHWHPRGQITWYSIEEFLRNFEPSHVDMELTDDVDSEDAGYQLSWDRPLCWIDNTTLGIGYNRGVGYYGEKKDFSSEILIYDLRMNKIARRIEFDGLALDGENEVKGELFFDADKQRFIGLSHASGLLITNINGQIIHRNPELSGWKYNPSHRLFYRASEEDKQIEIATEIN
jgi:hypothetical protein